VRLTESQSAKALHLLEAFKRAGLTVASTQGQVLPFRDFDQKRVDAIPEISRLLTDFLAGRVDLVGLKESHEVLCRRYDFWGFKSFSGQMVLNQLTNWSNASSEMTQLLTLSFAVPSDRNDATQKITSLHNRVGSLVPDGKNLRLGSLPYFVSYFWQIQAPDRIPVQYASSRHTLAETGLLDLDKDSGPYFRHFWDLLDAFSDLYAAHFDMTGVNRYWFVEHVLWSHRRESSRSPMPPDTSPRPVPDYLQYIPPILQDFCERSSGAGNGAAFETQVIQLFRMLGFHVQGLGQGKGREPDGIAYCREHNYAIIFDAKSSGSGYSIGTDDRTIVEYIRRYERELRKDGYSNIYFVIMSSGFRGTSKASIDRIRATTPIKSLVLLTAAQGLRLLANRIAEPNAFDFDAFQNLLLDSGELAQDSLDEFLEG